MQARTRGRQFDNLHKLTGGLLIAAALAAGAVGLTTIGELEIPGTGSDSASAPVSAPYVAPYYGEGLPLSPETPAIVADAALEHQTRQLTFPQGEGFPLTVLEQVESQKFAPLGEGLLQGSGQ
jgi:hypothetical protein